MAELEVLLDANRAFAEAFDHGKLPASPPRSVAVLTCMDARLHPERFLGLRPGDAHVIRNAGGRASEDAIRSLIVSSHLLGTKEFLVIHHTDCGMLSSSDDELRTRLAEGTEADTWTRALLTFPDLDQGVVQDVRRIVGSPFLPPRVSVSGHVYDVRTGRLRPVASPIETG
jgi:carbonic anhydrase